MILKFQSGVYVDDGTLNVKMVPVATLLGAQDYKASTGKYLYCCLLI